MSESTQLHSIISWMNWSELDNIEALSLGVWDDGESHLRGGAHESLETIKKVS